MPGLNSSHARSLSHKNIRDCAICGRRFGADRPRQVYCDSQCAKQAYQRCGGVRLAPTTTPGEVYTLRCPVCEVVFESPRSQRVYCGEACKRKRSRAKERRKRQDRYYRVAPPPDIDNTCPTCERRYCNDDFTVSRQGIVQPRCRRCHG